MKYRPFGTTDLVVSEMGFGCSRLGGFFEELSKPDLLRTLHQALDRGITFFDTADMYCQGESETLLGEALRGQRQNVTIATKVGYSTPSQRRVLARIKPVVRPFLRRLRLRHGDLPTSVRGTLTQNYSPDYITRSVEHSLKRLRMDYLDLYQLHSPPRVVLEHGEAFLALEKLRQQGKVRYYGVSCERVEDALLCLEQPGVASLQLRLSLLDQSALGTAIPAAAARGVAVIARECFAGGWLVQPTSALATENAEEKIDSDRRSQIARCERIALKNARTLPEAALQFVLGVAGVSVALVGMRTDAHLLSNLTYLLAPPLQDSEAKAFREVCLSTVTADPSVLRDGSNS